MQHIFHLAVPSSAAQAHWAATISYGAEVLYRKTGSVAFSSTLELQDHPPSLLEHGLEGFSFLYFARMVCFICMKSEKCVDIADHILLPRSWLQARPAAYS